MKILVVGFPRSGTSLTNRIFDKHPDVSKMLFEKWLLKQVKSINQISKKFPNMVGTYGEKVIWGSRIACKGTQQSIFDYCIEWNDTFGEEAKIIQLIRHPYDTLNSLFSSKKRFPRGPAFTKNYSEYLQFAPIFIQKINNLSNSLTVKYENLISDLDNTTKAMYGHCGINPSHKHSEKMKIKRIFNYKHKDLLFKYDDRLKDVIDIMNSIEGVKYEL